MVKVFALMPRRPELSPEEFRRHWREVHAPLVRRIRSVRRYVQSSPLEPAPFDGVAEIWLDDLAAVGALERDPDYLEGAWLDEPRLMDMSRHALLVTRERVVADGPASGGKRIVLGRVEPPAAARVVVCEPLLPGPYDAVLEVWGAPDDWRAGFAVEEVPIL